MKQQVFSFLDNFTAPEMSSIVELDLTLTNSSSERTAIMTPLCASDFLSWLFCLIYLPGAL